MGLVQGKWGTDGRIAANDSLIPASGEAIGRGRSGLRGC